MGDEEKIDRLVEKCLHDEAEDKDYIELEELCSQSPHNLDIYLNSIDHQLTLKEIHEEWQSNLPREAIVEIRSKTFPYWLIFSLIITIFVFTKLISSQRVSTDALRITNRSNEISLIRENKEIIEFHGETLQGEDFIEVHGKGELWLEIDNSSQLFIDSHSLLKVENYSRESFTLIKGSLNGTLKLGKAEFIFTTKDLEVQISKAEFSISHLNNETFLKVYSGVVLITHLLTGKKSSIKANHYYRSSNERISPFSSKPITPLFPVLENGVSYRYHQLNEHGQTDFQRLLDEGVTNQLAVKRGAHEGFVRHLPNIHSHINQTDFAMNFQSFFKAPESRNYVFKLKGISPSSLKINNQKITITDNETEKTLSLFLNKGIHRINLSTIGIIEEDQEGFSAVVEYKNIKGKFEMIPDDFLFFSNKAPLPELFNKDNINSGLSAHLPLNGNFTDTFNNLEAAPKGTPLFVKDPRFGTVLDLDGKDDYLVHLPVDKLGMHQSYTTSCWVKLKKKNHIDQVLFSNTPQTGTNSTLVLLIRRMFPYHAHLANDTIADEKLNNDEWYHISFRYFQGKQSIFVNGKLAISSYNHNILSSNQSLEIGRWGSRFLKGQLHDIRFYNTALHANDILKIYKSTLK